jgi:hypothetical protein
MFCVATAPTSDRRWAQRAVTAGDDEAIARAIRPVFGQSAAIENVMIGILSASA